MAAENTNVRLRRINSDDIDTVLNLVNKLPFEGSGITHQDLVCHAPGGPLDLSFIAEVDGKAVGFILARLAYLYVPFSEVCLIHAIVVDPEYQGRQIGSMMVNELINHCYNENISTIRALVNQHDNELKQFIEFLGFHRSTIINFDKTFEV
jgi:N-acetylglutamate synthase-like GNAT family acetyltransferase